MYIYAYIYAHVTMHGDCIRWNTKMSIIIYIHTVCRNWHQYSIYI